MSDRNPVDGISTEEAVLLEATGQPYVSIILPTFNESKNIDELLSRIHAEMTGAGYTYECIFVDDSKDTTPYVILEEAKKYEGNVGLVKRMGASAKTGLTMAFTRGFQEARGEIIVCMDTDLQHPPSKITALVRTVAERGVDVAVASRYTYGGSAEGLDGFFRRLVSKSSSYVVWLLLPATRHTTDPMTGFFAFSASLLTRITFSSLGFKVLVELLTSLESPKVIDIPFTFEKRREEVSKATLKQGFVFFRDIFRLFLTGARGSVGVRVLLVASMFAVSVGVSTTALVFAGLDTNLDGVRGMVEHFIILTLIAMNTVLFFGWALQQYGYWSFSYRNVGVCTFFVALMYGAYRYASGFFGEMPLYGLTAMFAGAVTFFGVYLLFLPLWHKQYARVVRMERWFIILAVLMLANVFSYFIDYSLWWNGVLLTLYLVVIFQGLFALYLMVYAWESPEEVPHDGTERVAPHYSFTAIVPCKHEKNTIADTVRAMHAIEYPADKKQVLIVIHEGTDDGTIDIVRDTIRDIGATNISLVTYNEEPVNKPHGLNVALAHATGDFVSIFDAEDEPHCDLFSVVNASLVSTGADVVQSGVQLMNYDSNWYSIFNVLEYYFWFKSSLHYFAKHNVTPLGGVSVFFRRSFLEQVGGWSMDCLTEDAEIGIRLSQAGAKMSIIYDAQYATHEETPPTVMGFIKQRTRWAQGFLQILATGLVWHFPTYKQKLLATYILAWPFIISFISLLLPFGIVLMLTVSLTPALAVLSNISLLLFLTFTIVLVLGFYEFTREYKLRFSFVRVCILVFLFYPYTLLLVVASMRALYRNLAQITVWEKTEHVNMHRNTDVSFVTQNPNPVQ